MTTFAPIGETIKQKAWRGPGKGIYLSLRIEKALGGLLPRGVKMLSYREGKLSLLTPSPAVSQEAYLNSAVIIKKLNESLGGKVVEKIGFRLSPGA